jgi:hypothetical protein
LLKEKQEIPREEDTEPNAPPYNQAASNSKNPGLERLSKEGEKVQQRLLLRFFKSVA